MRMVAHIQQYAPTTLPLPTSSSLHEKCLQRLNESRSQCADRIAKSESESRTLAALRDTLLPKLLSGEIRVADAEKTVEEVL